ncbi:MAG: hypothetical protein SPI25_03805, partial [Dialister sp.]|nr:hypothetical protein [Dialister sp.]
LPLKKGFIAVRAKVLFLILIVLNNYKAIYSFFAHKIQERLSQCLRNLSVMNQALRTGFVVKNFT